MQLAGETADGWIGVMASPEALETIVRPNIATGAERAGRNLSDLRLTAETICCVHPDPEVALRRARIHVGQYASNPLSDGAVAAAGLEGDRDAVRQALIEQGSGALAEITSNALVDAFTITGTPDEAREKVRAFDGLLDHIDLAPARRPAAPAERDRGRLRADRRDLRKTVAVTPVAKTRLVGQAAGLPTPTQKGDAG